MWFSEPNVSRAERSAALKQRMIAMAASVKQQRDAQNLSDLLKEVPFLID